MTRYIGRFQLVAIVLLLCVIIATPLVAAATESTASANIDILEGKDRIYDFNDLVSGLHPIEVAVQNKGNSPVTFTAKIVTNLSDKSGNPVPLQFSTLDNQSLPAEVSIPLDEVKFLAFGLNQPFLEVNNLQPGLYRGFIVLTNPANATIPFTLAVPSASLAPQGVASFAIKNPDPGTPLKVDYNALLKHHRIAVGIENTGKQTVNLTGTIIFSNLVDDKGKPLQLEFVTENETGGVESVQVAKGQVGFLYLNLTSPPEEMTFHEKLQHVNEFISNPIRPEERKSPRTGNYTGYITVTAEREGLSTRAPLTLFVPSEDMAIQTISWPAAMDWMQGWFKQLSLQYLDHELEPSDATLTILIVLVIFVIILGIRELSKRYTRSRPGPVTLNPITDATGDSLKTDGLNAYMRDHLENVGILPAGAKPYEDIAAAMDTVSAVVPGAEGLKLGNIIKGLGSLIFPPTGHKVTCTMRKETETKPYALICEIVGEKTKDTEKIDIVYGKTADEAVEEGAVRIYHYVVNEHKYVSQRVPPWARFSSAESLKMYQDGIDLEKKALDLPRVTENEPGGSDATAKETMKNRAALEKFRQAAREDPNNIYIRLALIECQKPKVIETISAYLSLVERWPVVLETRYRLAANLTFVEDLVIQINAQENSAHKKEIKDLLEKSSLISEEERETWSHYLDSPAGPDMSNDDMQGRKLFLDLAKHQCEDLKKELSWWGFLFKWLNSVYHQSYERKYYWYWVRNWNELRVFSKVMNLLEACICIRFLKYDLKPTRSTSCLDEESLESKVKKVVTPQEKAPWQLHYNAACFYALRIPNKPNQVDKVGEWEKENAILAETAVKHLTQVMDDPQFTDPTWLFSGDPDLNSLREHNEYTHWKSIVWPTVKSGAQDDSQAELDALCYAWAVVAAGATVERETLAKKVEEIKLWTEVHTREFNALCQRQCELWRALREWAHETGDKDRQTKFIEKISGATELPDKSALNCEKKDFGTYKKHWSLVVECVETLTDCWDRREDISEKDIHERTIAVTTNLAGIWAEEAYETWQALEFLGNHPLDLSAIAQFREKSLCSD